VDKDNKSTEKPEQVYSRKPVKSKKQEVKSGKSRRATEEIPFIYKPCLEGTQRTPWL
jgi:hypothetical protein